jgi:hypothetical protein
MKVETHLSFGHGVPWRHYAVRLAATQILSAAARSEIYSSGRSTSRLHRRLEWLGTPIHSASLSHKLCLGLTDSPDFAGRRNFAVRADVRCGDPPSAEASQNLLVETARRLAILTKRLDKTASNHPNKFWYIGIGYRQRRLLRTRRV